MRRPSMSVLDKTELINDEYYFKVTNFALVTRKSTQNIRYLMAKGNRIRKLKKVYIMDKPLIPATELTEFPFTMPGRKSKEVYFYDEEGQIV